MKKINGITSYPNQSFVLNLDDNTQVNCVLQFFPNQTGWYFNFSYGSLVVNTPLRLTNCPNILREYRDVLPFGIMIETNDGDEIFYIDDFENGRASFYLLNSDDVQFVEETIYGKI